MQSTTKNFPLRVFPARRYDDARALLDGEALGLRAAFGKHSDPNARERGVEISTKYRDRGMWFACECNFVEGHPPILVPVQNRGIRRTYDIPHHPDCVMQRDKQEQLEFLRSYRPAPKRDGVYKFDLVSHCNPTGAGDHKEVRGVSSQSSRPKLARLLCQLMSEAELDHIKIGADPLRTKAEQIAALRLAARSIILAGDRNLSDWIATSMKEFYDLRKRIQNSAAWGSISPHGVYIDTYRNIDNGMLTPNKAGLQPIQIAGRMSVYGRKSHDIEYLVIALLKREADNKVRIIRAYAHPCVSFDEIMLVDSSYEIDTIRIILRCLRSHFNKSGVETSIFKPIFDIVSHLHGDDVESDGTEVPRDPCRPDFILVPHQPGRAVGTVVVETMGDAKDDYRDRKKRMKPYFEGICYGEAGSRTVLEAHDRYLDSREEDERFYKAIRTLIG